MIPERSRATAWIVLRPGTFADPPALVATVDLGGIAGVHATGAAERETFDDLDDAILWAAERCPRIVVQAGDRLSAGLEQVAMYERFSGDAAARARGAVRAAYDRYAVERAADQDDDEHRWYLAVHDPALADDADAEAVAHVAAAHEDVVAIHVREDGDGTPFWILELEADSAATAWQRGHEIMRDAFWPPERRDAPGGPGGETDRPVGRGPVEVGLAEYLDEILLPLD